LNEFSSSSTIDLRCISKTPSIINIPYNTNPSRKSTSDIPNTSFKNTDYTTNIPKSLYTNPKQQSLPTSLTFTAVTENIQNELKVLTLEKEFVIDKTYFKNDFYGDHNSEKRSWFFKNFLQKRQKIHKCLFDFITLHKV
jgi:hypothetical protein